MLTFEQYIDERFEKDLKDIPNKIDNNHTRELLNQYKEVVLTNIIQQFGLGQIFDLYKRGGNVTTLYNAERGVFANEEDQQRFNKNYSQQLRKELYEKDFKKNRKQEFQQNEVIIDDYTGKILPKDGRAHRDHVKSASEIQQNNEARLYMSDAKRGEMAVDNKNLVWTDGSLNQSKGEHDLVTWMNKDNKKDSSQTNAEYYDIDEERAKQKYQEANNHINATIKKAKVDYYIKNFTSTGLKQGVVMGQKQAIGLFIYEFQEAVMLEMKSYFSKYPTLKTISNKVKEFKQACINVKNHMLSKAKKILISFTDGFISGFIGNLITIFINTFATTAKNIVRVLNEGVHALIKAVKILIKPPKGMTKKEAMLEASKIIAASLITTFGVILTEGFITYLKTTPFSPFAHLIGGVIGGILTGIVSVTVVYTIENFADVLNKIKSLMSDLTYDLKISAAEIRTSYYKAVKMLDIQYQEVLEKIYKEYEELHVLTTNAYNIKIESSKTLQNSVKLAQTLNVNDEKLMKNNTDVLNFFDS